MQIPKLLFFSCGAKIIFNHALLAYYIILILTLELYHILTKTQEVK